MGWRKGMLQTGQRIGCGKWIEKRLGAWKSQSGQGINPEGTTLAMNASSQSLVELIQPSSLRFVVPVYQRPYSWDREHCEQLWDDILAVGKRPDGRHFTGSVVWVQDGVMAASGVTPRLLIDGQQRVTTVTLLLVALAEYAQAHADRDLAFSFDEILNTGYLINRYRKGDDRYKLLLSQGDRETLKSILDHLENPERKLVDDSARIRENLDFFRGRLEALENPNAVWEGLQRLDIVSISLAAGQDNPQLIFESMNSTGKDLSSADLVRNFVLMGLPAKEQEELYLNHWRVIEETLGTDTDDEVFDAFIRGYLIVLHAPEPPARRDVYPLFKRHVQLNGYDKPGRMKVLLEELEVFARYYSDITRGTAKEPRLKAAFDSLARLDITAVNPFLMSLCQDFEAQAFSLDDFESMLRTLESYMFRRAVCDVPSNALTNFLASVIARLNKVQEDGENYREAFEAYLRLEDGTARRFPGNAEFAQTLATRDIYQFRKAFYLLTCLENAHHPKNPIDFSTGPYTIEHIMPRNALASEEWRAVLGDAAEEEFEVLVHNLGNLTLTTYNSELSDATFAEKRNRCIGGYNEEYLAISHALAVAEKWGRAEIEKRATELVETAKKRWPELAVTTEAAQKYAPEKDGNAAEKPKAEFRSVFAAGLILPGAKLVPVSEKYSAVATVTETGMIALPDGQEFHSPSLATIHAARLAGIGASSRNGWTFWRIGTDGPVLDELRSHFLAGQKGRREFRIAFWRGFYEHCSTIPGFVEAFNDPADRIDNPDSWARFGIGAWNCELDAFLWKIERMVGVKVYCREKSIFAKILSQRGDIDTRLAKLDGEIIWDDLNADKKSRSLTVRRTADWENADLSTLYEWMVKALFELRSIAMEFV